MTLRAQDILFGILGLTVAALIALHYQFAVLALAGAFLCGALYLLIGMLPSREQSFGERAFTSVFLALVLSSLVLILPCTTGAPPSVWRKPALIVAGALPALALAFETARTPRLIEQLWRLLGRR
jgi:hypothetical protein